MWEIQTLIKKNKTKNNKGMQYKTLFLFGKEAAP